MIGGTGIDIVSIVRVSNIITRYGNKFISRILTESERIYIEENILSQEYIDRYIAKRFAAKEAVSKALGCGIGKNLSFLDISIAKADTGRPLVDISSKVSSFIKEQYSVNRFSIHLSIADEQEHAIAQAILELN